MIKFRYLTILFLTTVAKDDKLVIEQMIKHNCGRRSKIGDKLELHYVGKLENKRVFDSSRDRDQTFSFQIGKGEVIQGWERGLLEMCPGDMRRLIVPPSLGYGDMNMGKIPANSYLFFEVQLVSIYDHVEDRKYELQKIGHKPMYKDEL